MLKKKVMSSGFGLGKDSPEVTSKELEAVVTDGTEVECSSGFTVSEKFQVVRVDCSIRIPTTLKKRQAAVEEGWKFIEAELSKKLGEARKLLQKL